MESELNSVAEQLHGWFLSIVRVLEESLFSIVPEGPHRDAVVLDALKRSASLLSQSEVDCEGKLYAPLCFFLAAACRKLGLYPGVGHWRTAMEDVVRLQGQTVSARTESAIFGLELGGLVAIFKQKFDEAINQSAAAGGASFLNKEDRHVALDLAVNWGMRLLLAYASDCSGLTNDPTRKDLAWVASLIDPELRKPH